MNLKLVFYLIGILNLFLALSMTAPLTVSVLYNDGSALSILNSLFITLLAGLTLVLLFRTPNKGIRHREGMAVVALGWLSAGIFGALPFFLDGSQASYLNCLFESLSGFTTTGASIMTDVEVLPKGILFWRSLTHWLGGMGIIVMTIAILPLLGVGGMQLYKAEVPGPTADKLQPRITETAKTLWKVYLVFTGAEVILLHIGGMNLFDSFCHAFGTLATGGFSTKNASIGHYQSVYFDTVITVFMLLAGINFALHYQALTGNIKAFYKNSELRFFLGVFLLATTLVTWSIWKNNVPALAESLHLASFQAASILTTTGYTTADFEQWPSLARIILIVLIFIGGSAGSTGGSIKCIRILLLLKHTYRELRRLIHPRAVIPVKLQGKVISDDIMSSIWGFFILFLSLFIVASILLTMMGIDLTTSFTAVAATIGNIGPGLGSVGPTDSYAHLPQAAKVILILCMLLGRLEVYTVFILFVPEFWKK
ncbi:MAG: TrkH family potassium uptake protein [Deltaproteobacteria bacterium]|nr:TrkH family potassium uptake protein [Deltaproteobacteria bacterium]MBW2052687.1 TrkH family potassium uptake protein [Deltaproteobacteria bacterium]MBW2140981.1 TrkH family potassium uptake protein [Deltaproteobacteria bacterium]MBW2323150.1 TrkH family potassium uptake protein [Deltaproteobacteria bacterium]